MAFREESKVVLDQAGVIQNQELLHAVDDARCNTCDRGLS
jgi:hypothetical protein